MYLRLLYMLEWTGLPLGSNPTYSERRQVPPKSSPCSKTTHSKGESGAVKCLAAASPAGPAPTTATCLPCFRILTAFKMHRCTPKYFQISKRKGEQLGHPIGFIYAAESRCIQIELRDIEYSSTFCGFQYGCECLCRRQRVESGYFYFEMQIARGCFYKQHFIFCIRKAEILSSFKIPKSSCRIPFFIISFCIDNNFRALKV